MEPSEKYLMENPDEAKRLDIKTDPDAVRKQALLCGIGPGSRVLDGGCGSGKTTSVLHEMVRPAGSAVGIDFARDRIDFARRNYGDAQGIEFACMDLRDPLDGLGTFDFVWIRFVLEYYLEGSKAIIENASRVLGPGGRICLIDLDYNCLSHYPLNRGMEKVLQGLLARMMEKYNFDPYVGRKLYTFLYDLGFEDIQVHLMAHHLIYGELRQSDDFNWFKKLEMASVKARDVFDEYPGGIDAFFRETDEIFHSPRRFTYTPLLLVHARKPG
jgi:ubiquinone/menaquinone biosynthesis C-methylase UbiE